MKKQTFSCIYKIIIAILLLINIVLIAISIAIWIGSAQGNQFHRADFTYLYTGFAMVRSGDGNKLYDLDLQSKYQSEILGDSIFDSGLVPFLNPPIFALILSPLALLPLQASFYVWSIVELGLFGWFTLLFIRLFPHWTKRERLIALITILSFWPLTLTFLLGQLSLLLLVFTLLVYSALQKDHLYRAGIWLNTLVVKPQALLVPVMMTFNKRYWRVLIAAAASGIVMVFFAGIVLGFDVWREYLQTLPLMNTYFGKFGSYPDVQYTFRGILTNLLGYPQANTINIISMILLVISMLVTWRLWSQDITPKKPAFTLYFAFTILLSVFFSLHAYPHDDLLLIIPAILFYDYLRTNHYPMKYYSIFILISPAIFIISAFVTYRLFGVIRPPVILIMVLIAWMAYYIVDERRTGIKNTQLLISPIE